MRNELCKALLWVVNNPEYRRLTFQIRRRFANIMTDGKIGKFPQDLLR